MRISLAVVLSLALLSSECWCGAESNWELAGRYEKDLETSIAFKSAEGDGQSTPSAVAGVFEAKLFGPKQGCVVFVLGWQLGD